MSFIPCSASHAAQCSWKAARDAADLRRLLRCQQRRKPCRHISRKEKKFEEARPSVNTKGRLDLAAWRREEAKEPVFRGQAGSAGRGRDGSGEERISCVKICQLLQKDHRTVLQAGGRHKPRSQIRGREAVLSLPRREVFRESLTCALRSDAILLILGVCGTYPTPAVVLAREGPEVHRSTDIKALR